MYAFYTSAARNCMSKRSDYNLGANLITESVMYNRVTMYVVCRQHNMKFIAHFTAVKYAVRDIIHVQIKSSYK